MLKAFGFQHDWVQWISNLVSLAFFSILVNGAPSTTFHTTRGLRQGDLLSPFLFILMVEGLGRALKARKVEGAIKGVRPHEGMDPQTHQQFVDDTMLMGVSSVREAREIKDTLEIYKRASGLEVNKDKSQIYYFNTPPIMRQNINRILEFVEGYLPSKYLGAPLLEGKATHRNWKELLVKMSSKLNNWMHQALNFPRQLTLVKLVLQAMPSYVLSAPKKLSKKSGQFRVTFFGEAQRSNKNGHLWIGRQCANLREQELWG